MTVLKRIIAGISAMVIMFSSGICSGFTVIAEGTETGEFSVNIPETWTNSCKGWITASTDVTVYYKTSSVPLDKSAWGSFSDNDAKIWDSGSTVSETDLEGDYIKFWAVQGEKILDDRDAVKYYYDITAPEDFELYKEDDGINHYIITSRGNVRDSLSGISKIYYSEASDLSTKEKLENLASKANVENRGNDEKFSIDCTADMNGKEIYVYLIDFAGNIQSSSIIIDSYKDNSAPNLTVEGIDSNKWYNKNSLNEWKIQTTSPDATIYYKTADTDLGEDWGNYSEAEKWDDQVVLPQGQKYIHFWAA